MQLLVTGANGFLGSEIVRQGTAAGVQVRATDRGECSRFSILNYARSDVLDPNSLEPAVKGIEYVIHAAGLAHIFDKSKAASAPFKAVNEIGTANVARIAVQSSVKHLILISSVAVYGPHSVGFCDEAAPCRPTNPYAESKWQAEQRAIEITQNTETRLTILRLATVYGEEDPGNILRLIRMIDRGRFVWVGSGNNLKSFIYRGDAAKSCLAALLRPDDAKVQVFNVSAPPCTMGQVVQLIAAALDRKIPEWHISPGVVSALARLSKTRVLSRSLGSFSDLATKWLADDAYDATRIRRALGFQAETSLEEGLSREVDWYRTLSGQG